MAPVVETHSLGLEVELGEIDKQLKKLWAEGEGAMTRASLINLAIYSQAAASLDKNTELIAQLTQNHACRAIVIEAKNTGGENEVESWISAHCHVTKSGSKQICSEQISFRLKGACTKLLPSVVFSHLDSDLPFYLWWQEEFPEEMDPQLWTWVDRLIFDSSQWQKFGRQMQLVETAQQESKQRIVLCDLDWTRLDKIRYAIAQFFDHPASHHHFSEIENVRIDFAPDYRSAAILLVGWLAAQLHWRLETKTAADHFQFRDSADRKIDIELRSQGGPLIGPVVLNSGGVRFAVAPAQCGDLLQISRSGAQETAVPQMMPAQSNQPVDLMTQELLRGGSHRVYLRAVASVRQLF